MEEIENEVVGRAINVLSSQDTAGSESDHHQLLGVSSEQKQGHRSLTCPDGPVF